MATFLLWILLSNTRYFATGRFFYQGIQISCINHAESIMFPTYLRSREQCRNPRSQLQKFWCLFTLLEWRASANGEACSNTRNAQHQTYVEQSKQVIRFPKSSPPASHRHTHIYEIWSILSTTNLMDPLSCWFWSQANIIWSKPQINLTWTLNNEYKHTLFWLRISSILIWRRSNGRCKSDNVPTIDSD